MAEAAGNATSNNSEQLPGGQQAASQNVNGTSGADDVPLTPEEEAKRSQIRAWPHKLSFLFACLTCTVGMFSISRFAILTIDFGVIFIVQFLLLSFMFGIPLLVFHSSLGQYLGSGVIDMWRISPIQQVHIIILPNEMTIRDSKIASFFQGIGVALMISQGLYGIYNIAAISWLFVYFRDSFITAFDRYRWSSCFQNPNYE